MAAAPPRPPALTLTCVFVGVGSMLLLFELMGLLNDWGSVELQEAVRDGLEAEPLASAGIGLEQALGWLRWVAYAGIVVATCGIVFAIYTARGHRASRVLLTALCALAAFTFAAGGLAGLLPAIFAAVCGTSLWTPEARQWFDALAGKEPAVAAGAPAAAARSGADPFAPTTPTSATAGAPSGTPADADAEQASAPTGAAAHRPKAVRTAATITLVACGLVGTAGLLTLLAGTVGADAYRASLEQPGMARDLLEGSGLSADEIVAMLRWASVTWLVMSLLGAAAAIATLRRVRAGVVLLRLTCVLTVAVSVLFLPVGVVTAAAAVVVFLQLRRDEVGAWLRTPSP